MEAMKDTIKENDWMSDETKQHALQKVGLNLSTVVNI